MPKKYRAFISYSHADIKFARWLQRTIENYKIPKKLREKYPHLPKDLKRSIFRDEEELPTSSALPDNLTKALEDSEFLIVIASPYSVNSKWVNQEISYFKNYHKNGNVLAIIKAGEPYAKEGQLEAFPEALTADGEEPIASDARSFRGRKRAVMKLIAGLLQVDFADLWEREVKERRKRKLWLGGALSLFALISIYSSFQFQGNLVNEELQQIEKRIATIEYTLHHGVGTDEEAIRLNIELKKLEEKKDNKEASLEALGRLESSIGKKAKRLYQEKGAKEAIKLLTSKERIVQREQEKQELSKESLTLAKLYIETHEYDKANETFQEAIRLFYSFKNVHEYGRFLRDQREPQKAIEYYEEVSNTPLQREEKLKLLSSLALVYDENNQLKESEKSYKKAVKLYREKPNTMREDFARTLDNMGNLYRMTNRIEDAIRSHQEALEIERKLEEQRPKKYRFNLFSTLTNLGNAYKDINEFQKSEAYYREALALIRVLNKDELNKHRGELALLLGNMSSIYDINRKFTEANHASDEALLLLEELTKENPAVYMEQLAERLSLASARQTINHQDKKAEESINRSLKLSQQLFKKNPNLYAGLLSQVLYMRALKYIMSQEHTEALASLEEALQIAEKLKTNNPDLYYDRIASINMQYSTLYLFYIRDLEKAEESILQAVKFYRVLAKKHPRKYNESLADALDSLASFYSAQKQTKKAKEAHIESVAFYKKLAEKNPDYYHPYLATKLGSLANFYQNIGKIESAEKIYLKALKMQRELAQKYPKLYKKDLATILWKFSFLYMNHLRDLPKGEALILEAISIQEVLAEAYPKSHLERLSSFLDYLGTYYNLDKQFIKAEKILLKSLKINKILVRLDNKKYEALLAKNFYGLASVYRKFKRPKEAKEYQEKALKLYRKLVQPTTFARAEMAEVLTSLAKREENVEEAENLYLEALEIRKSLREEKINFSDSTLATLLGDMVDFYRKSGKKEQAKRLFEEEWEARKRSAQIQNDAIHAWGLGLTAMIGVKEFNKPLSTLDEAKKIMKPFKEYSNVKKVFEWMRELESNKSN